MNRFRSEKHRRWVAARDCIACYPGYSGNCGDSQHTDERDDAVSQCCHLRRGHRGGMGLKPSDEWTVPLCERHHRHMDTHPEGPAAWAYETFVEGTAERLAEQSPWVK